MGMFSRRLSIGGPDTRFGAAFIVLRQKKLCLKKQRIALAVKLVCRTLFPFENRTPFWVNANPMGSGLFVVAKVQQIRRRGKRAE